jgi:hypothetical protein
MAHLPLGEEDSTSPSRWLEQQRESSVMKRVEAPKYSEQPSEPER